MRAANDALQRQWLMLRQIPRYPRKITAGEVTLRLKSEGFNITKRTIERDLQALSERFPLISDDREKPFGWSWAPDAAVLDVPGMAPAQALTFMLVREHLMAFFPSSFTKLLNPYFSLADTTLSGSGQSPLARWKDKISMVPPTQPLLHPQVDPQALAEIHEGLLSERQLRVQYRSRVAAQIVEYIVHPLGIVMRGPVAYLVCTLFEYTDPRLLALHRFTEAVVLPHPRLTPPDFSLTKLISEGTFGFIHDGKIELVVRFNVDAAEHLRETPLSSDQSISSVLDGQVTVTATVVDNQQLRWWLLGFGDQIEVVEPPSLREFFYETANKMAIIYSKNQIQDGG